jgi:hypothetical protein
MNDSVKLAAMAREIGELAPRVGKEYAEQQDAFHQQHLAEVRLLTSLVNMVKPGLPAISRNIASHYESGVLVFDGKGNNGKPVRLYLIEDGTFWKTWEYLDEDCGEWKETGSFRSIDEAADEFDITPIIFNLNGLLAKQAGKRKASTVQAREKVNTINAILTLLGSPQPPPQPPPGFDEDAASDIPF